MPENKNDLYSESKIWYKALVDTHPEIQIKGENMLYTSVNGHMFSIMNMVDGEVGLRLPEEARNQFIEDYQTELHGSYGAVMREYVRIPVILLSKTDLLKPYLVISYDYVKSLKPKAQRNKSRNL